MLAVRKESIAKLLTGPIIETAAAKTKTKSQATAVMLNNLVT